MLLMRDGCHHSLLLALWQERLDQFLHIHACAKTGAQDETTDQFAVQEHGCGWRHAVFANVHEAHRRAEVQ